MNKYEEDESLPIMEGRSEVFSLEDSFDLKPQAKLKWWEDGDRVAKMGATILVIGGSVAVSVFLIAIAIALVKAA